MTNQKTPRPLEGPLWVTGFIGFTLLIVCGAAYMAILQEEASNPRAARFAELWPSVAVGHMSAEAVEVMGQPDVDEEAFVAIYPQDNGARDESDDPSSTDPSVCVRKLTWYSWQDRGSGMSYSVCLDEHGVVLKKTTAMTFQLTNW